MYVCMYVCYVSAASVHQHHLCRTIFRRTERQLLCSYLKDSDIIVVSVLNGVLNPGFLIVPTPDKCYIPGNFCLRGAI